MYNLNEIKIQTYNNIQNDYNNATAIIGSQANSVSTDLQAKYNIFSQNKLAETQNVCRNIQLTNSTIPNSDELTKIQIKAAVDSSVSELEKEAQTSTNFYGATLDHMVDTQQANASLGTKLYADKAIKTNGVSGSDIAYLLDWADRQCTSIGTGFISFLSNMKDAFMAMMNDRLNAMKEAFNSILNNISNFKLDLDYGKLIPSVPIPNPLDSLEALGTPIYDFYKRVKGQGSTSLYVQQKKPDPNDPKTQKENPSAKATLPTSVIVIPKVKIGVQTVKHYLNNPLAKFFPKFLPKMIPYTTITITGETIKS